MAKLLRVKTEFGDDTWINAELVRVLTPKDSGTLVVFANDHSLYVEESVEAVRLRFSLLSPASQ
jgi:hypothetical protein